MAIFFWSTDMAIWVGMFCGLLFYFHLQIIVEFRSLVIQERVLFSRSFLSCVYKSVLFVKRQVYGQRFNPPIPWWQLISFMISLTSNYITYHCFVAFVYIKTKDAWAVRGSNEERKAHFILIRNTLRILVKLSFIFMK